MTAVARAEAQGGQEGTAGRQWASILEEAGVVATGAAEAEALEGAEDADLEPAKAI